MLRRETVAVVLSLVLLAPAGLAFASPPEQAPAGHGAVSVVLAWLQPVLEVFGLQTAVERHSSEDAEPAVSPLPDEGAGLAEPRGVSQNSGPLNEGGGFPEPGG